MDDNYDFDKIKSLKPSNIRKFNDQELIGLINRNNTFFFNNINEDALKVIKKEVFNRLKEECIKAMTIENLELLAKADKIQFLPDTFLKQINKPKFKQLSENFFMKINEKQIIKAGERVLKIFIEFKKYVYLNDEVLKCFCQEIPFSNLDSNHIGLIIGELDKRGKLKYITGENFTYLENHIGSEELAPFLDKMKSIPYIDNKRELNSFFFQNNDSILEENDIKDEDKIIINTSKISSKIENYINSDNYELLKTYCIKCCSNVKNKDTMLNTLNSLLKYSKDNIYDLIDELEIRKILMFISNDNESNKLHFKRNKQIIKDIQKIEPFDPDEFMSKMNLFSQIIKDNSYSIDFLEMIAEENLKNVKLLLQKYYNGTDQNAAPSELKKKNIEIINDYMNIIEKKYKIDKNKIFNELQKIKGDNLKEQLSVFENSLNNHEKLYYDLLVQAILEQPNSETWIESYTTPIFKIIRNIIITVCGIKLASLTGSRILTSLSASIGGALIFKDVKEEIVKTYFSMKDEEKRVYHLNQKNSSKRTFYIIKKKIKEKYRKCINPIKNYCLRIINQKILKLKEEPKIGFDREYNINVNIEEEYETFIDNEINNYYKKVGKINKIKYTQKLQKFKTKFESKKRLNQSKTLIKFFDVKKKIINKIVENKEKEIKNEYPDLKEPNILDNALKGIHKVGSLGFGIFKSLSNVVTFGLTTDFWSKKNDVENLLEMVKNIKYNEFQNKLKKLEKKKEESNLFILYEDIKYLAKSNSNDYRIFSSLKDQQLQEKNQLENEQNYFQIKIVNRVNKNKKKKKNKNKNKTKELGNLNEIIERENISEFNENDFNKSELSMRLLENEDNESDECIINTNSH